jgi:hypothetical protein
VRNSETPETARQSRAQPLQNGKPVEFTTIKDVQWLLHSSVLVFFVSVLGFQTVRRHR